MRTNNFIDIIEIDKESYNKVVHHPLQSYEWGQFRKKTGVKVVRCGFVKNGKIVSGFTLTIHKIPYTNLHIGYLPKGAMPTKEILEKLASIGKSENCIFIQLEPNVQNTQNYKLQIENSNLKPSFHPLFTKYTFVLDLQPSEEELLKNMHPKTRYNIKVAKKHGVWVEEDSSKEGFENYINLMLETTNRQKFYAHTRNYHKNLWESLSKAFYTNNLTYHLFNAKYKKDNKIYTLTSWVLFVFHNTLYYPYGASGNLFRETMASNLIAWEAILFGKKLNLKNFDMWGALGPNPDKNDPWYGFHRFKEGYGGKLVEFVGSYDLVINPLLYQFYKAVDKLRWFFLRLNK
ncbi:MAG: hypothetical protein A2857_00925 [Candidatus Levybacteria bacterium RIFCSPHIGHO2_01_FULL_36_15]|nr:MAG: hypothetical protein A2857_00925 [Candidatus Levybacteria bacterium RIFCSPHIGHO2_01_FULL_36_15]OGH37287.1 MAG: hypothetical protein A2905_01125 [Candidatus Levybacteria bacterium RIFCSPLOWO2_01_FULL_36_10]